jgi:hypothetical protein
MRIFAKALRRRYHGSLEQEEDGEGGDDYLVIWGIYIVSLSFINNRQCSELGTSFTSS